MKYLSCLTLFACVLFAFDSKPKTLAQLVKPQMTQINAAYFCDKYEVSNAEWKKYRSSIAEKYGLLSEKYEETSLDTTVWGTDLKYPDPIMESYHKHPAFDNYPVVGVSYQQAQNYIAWRAEQVNADLVKYGINELIIMRLPTNKEWEDLASIGLSSFYQRKSDRKKRKLIEVKNFQTVLNNSYHHYSLTAPVDEFYPNALGLYNLRGNVAEMVKEEGIAKGGSWLDREIDSPLSRDFTYDKSKAWLGFRVVMLVSGKTCSSK